MFGNSADRAYDPAMTGRQKWIVTLAVGGTFLLGMFMLDEVSIDGSEWGFFLRLYMFFAAGGVGASLAWLLRHASKE